MRGVFEYTIEGKVRGFHFNFDAFAHMEEISGLDLDDLIQKLTAKGSPKVRLLSQFFYAGALNYCETKGLPKDFTQKDVSEWVAEIGLKKAFEMIGSALGVKTPKNSVPLPEMEG